MYGSDEFVWLSRPQISSRVGAMDILDIVVDKWKVGTCAFREVEWQCT